MNQGGTTDTATTLEPNSIEKFQVGDPGQLHVPSYYASTGSSAMSWATHGANSYPGENGIVSDSSYHHDQQTSLTSRGVHDGLNAAPVASTSNSGLANVPQDYGSYTTYQSSDPYGYNNSGYAAYYSGYQQQTSQSYPPSVGAYQNSGAPYQPLSSFQNTGSYAGTASYSSTYYNPADYQTSGGYQNGTYGGQTNYWHGGQYPTYTAHQYPSYPADSNGAYTSTGTVATSQYSQHYKQWADYYSQTQTEVSCAPGTENVSLSGASSLSCPIPGVTNGYQTPSNQQPVPYSQSWMPESSSSEPPSIQPATASSSVNEAYWKPGAGAFQIQNFSMQQHVQSPIDPNSAYQSSQNQQTPTPAQAFNSPYPSSHQLPQSYQPPLQPVSQTVLPVDSRKVNKLQIPTNPRIAPNLAVGLSRSEKDGSPSTTAANPYIRVSLPKPNDKVPSHNATADTMLKPGVFPQSLRGYVERALARCKDDALLEASQVFMKEIITKATADGTLYTRDWDTEPLFPLPNSDAMNKEGLLLPTPSSSLPKTKRSPGRRSKSRWEPILEEKLDKPAAVIQENVKHGGWNKQFSSGKLENKADHSSYTKFSLPNLQSPKKNVLRPAKRQRLVDGLHTAENGEASSDSDKEQDLTAYYSAAVAIADSPEERKRRENRSKRFERGNGNRAERNHFRPKSARTGNLYARRGSASVLSRNHEESGSKAVEDIDWDALTVKGTCQEIEKRYLRLTSAPDPATVRPEEVLEKALHMVQNSEKNYLYKCDQLKSIRQDLTVQRIRNELTVKVYETHARFAIEVGDLPEYNQCQSQLKILYAEGIRGCHMEFAAYNLLCVILHSNNNRDLLSAMSRLSAEARNNDAVKHALAVRAAVTSGNFVLFFRLYKAATNLNTYLMDLYVEKMRYAAVTCMSRSYRPTVPVSYISLVLGFTNPLPITEISNDKETVGMEECVEWLKAHGACLTKDNSGEMLLDTKLSMSSLYMPEPEDAVAHGDATLAVDDFLARNPV